MEYKLPEYWRQVVELVRNYDKPATDTSIEAAFDPARSKPLVAYRGEGWAICKYQREKDEQTAFNLVMGCFPEDAILPRNVGPSGNLEVIILQPLPSQSDPMGQDGYIGIKKRKGTP